MLEWLIGHPIIGALIVYLVLTGLAWMFVAGAARLNERDSRENH